MQCPLAMEEKLSTYMKIPIIIFLQYMDDYLVNDFLEFIISFE